MRTLFAILILTVACFGQARQNVVQTGTVDARGANWLPPSSTFASPPATPAAGSVYIFTDASSVGTCSAGGSSLATCRWSGSAWAAVSGGGGGGGAPYLSSLIAGPDSAKTIAGATHGFATTALLVAVYDNASPRNAIAIAWTVNASTYDVVITFGSPQSNYYVVINGGAGPQGAPGSAGSSGSNGAAGQGYTWRGAYAGGSTYAPYDTVSYNGSTYVCILASTGNLPTNATYFSLVAQKGSDGSGASPVVVTFNTATPSCSPGCTATSSPPAITVVHNLGTAAPGVWVYDGGGLVGSNISSIVPGSPTTTTTVVTFTSAESGTATFTTGGVGPTGGNGTNGTGYGGASSNSLTPGTTSGATTITASTGLAYGVGSCVQLTSSVVPTAYIVGPVTAYTPGTGSLTFTATTAATAGTCSGAGGSGAHSDWVLSLVGVVGAAGASGSGTGTINTGATGNVAVYTGVGTTVGPSTGTGYMKLASGVLGTPAAIPIGDLPTSVQTETKCFDLGTDNASADLVDADIGPQGRVFMVPTAATIIEIAVAANAGTPNVILQKNHTGTATDLVSATLATGSAGAVACAATGAACLDGTAKSGSVTITTAGSANVLAAGDWIQTKTGSGFASSGAKRLSVCVTYSR